MGRPRKINPYDLDAYNEASLNLEDDPVPEKPYDPETDDILPELGETDRHDRFDRLDDEDLFQDRRA